MSGRRSGGASRPSGGLVKQLLFPSYTEAGSNDAFRAQPQERPQQQVHDHEVQYDGSQIGGYAPNLADDSLLTHAGAAPPVDDNNHDNDEMETASDESSPMQQQNGNTDHGPRPLTAEEPLSPPLMHRRSPVDPPSIHTDSRREGASMSPKHAIPTQERLSAHSAKLTNTIMSSMNHPKSNPHNVSIDQVSVSMMTTVSSGVASTVLGYHFLPEGTAKEDSSRTVVRTTNRLPNHSNASQEDQDEENDQDDTSEVGSLVSVMGSADGAKRQMNDIKGMDHLFKSLNHNDDDIIPEEDDETKEGPPALAFRSTLQKNPVETDNDNDDRNYSDGDSDDDDSDDIDLGGAVDGLAFPSLDGTIATNKSSFRPKDETNHSSNQTRHNAPLSLQPPLGGNSNSSSNRKGTNKISEEGKKTGRVSAAFRSLGSRVDNLTILRTNSNISPETVPWTSPPPAPRTPNQNNSMLQQLPSLSPRSLLQRGSPRDDVPVASQRSAFRSSMRQQQQRPGLLRSPVPLSPRPYNSLDPNHNLGAAEPSSPGGKHLVASVSPFRRAKQCFSFDADQHIYPGSTNYVDRNHAMDSGVTYASGPFDSSSQNHNNNNNSPPTSPMGNKNHLRRPIVTQNYDRQNPTSRSMLHTSKSWDMESRFSTSPQFGPPSMGTSGTPSRSKYIHPGTMTPGRNFGGVLRQSQQHRQQQRSLQQPPPFFPTTQPTPTNNATTNLTKSAFRNDPVSDRRIYPGRGFLHRRAHSSDAPINFSQFSPAITNTKNAMELRTPQRVEIEREDALDILACLVERSVAFHHNIDEDDNDKLIEGNDESDEDDSSVGNDTGDVEDENSKENLDESFSKKQTPLVTNATKTKGSSGDDDNNVTSPSPAPTPKAPQLVTTPIPGLIRQKSGASEIADAVSAIRKMSRYYEKQEQNSISEKASGDTSCIANPNHEARMRALDELMRSHKYALEMKRAALSASTWLRAIGRASTPKNEVAAATDLSHRKNTSSDDAFTYSYLPCSPTLESSDTKLTTKDESDGKNSKTNMDIIALSALLRAAEFKVAEKDESVERLNEELSKCRMEIGRLKSTARADVTFTSPNRSILDDSNDDSSAASSNEADAELARLETALQDVSTIQETSIEFGQGESSFNDTSTKSRRKKEAASKSFLDSAEAKRELIMLSAALEKANEKIRELEAEQNTVNKEAHMEEVSDGSNSQQEGSPEPDEIEEGKNEEENVTNIATESDTKEDEVEVVKSEEENEHESDNLKTTAVSDPTLEKHLDEYKETLRKAYEAEIESLKEQLNVSEAQSIVDDSAGGKLRSGSLGDQRMINVRMLDGENFVTEWDDLAPPLPPPPDHGLRSPIVDALLSQWTDDKNMHSSLLKWIVNILDGKDPGTVPPLKISSLDHQIRDGFTMHILPLLLRRSDIHVEVTTRAHRRTTYDLAVSISQSKPSRDGAVSFGANMISSVSQTNTDTRTTVVTQRPTNNMHMMAYKASRGGPTNAEEEGENDGDQAQSSVRSRVSDIWKARINTQTSDVGNVSITSSSITQTTSNRLLAANSTSIGHRRQVPASPKPYIRGFNQQPPPSPLYGPNEHPSGASVGSVSIGDETSVGSSITGGSLQRGSQPPGIMTTIGDTFGGIFSRKKTTTPGSQMSPNRNPSFDDECWGEPQPLQAPQTPKYHSHRGHGQMLPSIPSSPTRSDDVNMGHHEEEPQPYHRVVSAPPGRIGITFVEVRGHAMISDVAPDSPLFGWVFPSDILIAIDEVPVSGLRVREIVKLLTARKERQRALRVISSHAMTELTQSTGAGPGSEVG